MNNQFGTQDGIRHRNTDPNQPNFGPTSGGNQNEGSFVPFHASTHLQTPQYQQWNYQQPQADFQYDQDQPKYTGPRDEQGEAHGKGEMVYQDGSTYKGEFFHGQMDGLGGFVAGGDPKTGYTYSGSWKMGRKHGRGVLKWPNGQVYEAEWKDNVLDGNGWYTTVEGQRIECTWVKGIQTTIEQN